MKNSILVVSLVLLLCFVFGCQDKAEKTELEKFRAQAKLEEKNKALVRQYLEALDSGSLEKALAAADATLAPDIISHFAEGDSEGIEHIKNNLKSDYESWSDIQHPIERGQVNTPSETCRNDGKAPGRERSAPDVEGDRLRPFQGLIHFNSPLRIG